MKNRLIIHIALLLQIVWIVSAQTDECPIEIDLALDTANEICFGTGRNQVCYGNNNVDATPYDDVQLDFEAPGDVASLEEIHSLSLSALDTENGRWGIALMRMLANLNPTQSEDVTVLLFGDVEIEDATGEQNIQVGTATTYSNLRRSPNTDAAIMDSVAIYGVVHITGKLEDNSWVRVVNPETNIAGWMLASLVADVDLELVDVVSANQPYFAPMQAFYFNGDGGSIGCSSVPRDGIVIQTPEGLRRVTLWVNEVTIDLLANNGGVTTSLQLEDDGSMSVNVLEGSVFVGNDTNGYVAVAGSAVNVASSSGGSSISNPIPIRSDSMQNMPTDVLDRDIELPEPASDASIAEANGFVEVETPETDLTVDEVVDTDGTTNTEPSSNSSSNSSADAESNDSSGKPDCPGNSCNAPGKNKDKVKKEKKEKKDK